MERAKEEAKKGTKKAGTTEGSSESPIPYMYLQLIFSKLKKAVSSKHHNYQV